MALPDALPTTDLPLTTRLADVVVSEWTKIRSIRSTFWLLAVAAVTAIGGSGIVAVAQRSNSKPPIGDPVASVFLSWLEYPILALGILGALSFTSEYATGQIRTTLAAVPQRLTVFVAKASVTGLVALAFGEALAFASFLLGEGVLAGRHGSTSLAHPGVPTAVLGAGYCLFAVALLGLALGAIMRTTAGAVAAVPALIYLPLVALSLPHPWNYAIGKFTLLTAAYQIVSEHQRTGLLSRPLCFAVVAGWPAVALLAASVVIRRHDA